MSLPRSAVQCVSRSSFHPLTNRKHHCRLCGRIICSLPVKFPQRPETCSLLFVVDQNTGRIEEVGEGVDSAGVEVGVGVDSAGVDVGSGVDSVGVDVGSGVDSTGVDVGSGVDTGGGGGGVGAESLPPSW